MRLTHCLYCAIESAGYQSDEVEGKSDNWNSVRELQRGE